MKLSLVLDEGGFVGKGMFPGLPVELTTAAIATAEKGYLSLELKAEKAGGHSAMPALDGNAVTMLSKLLVKLQENPMPASLRVCLLPFVLIIVY